jgi:hypothetical protein
MQWKPAPRNAQTTIPCSYCKKPLMAGRTCHAAYLRCEGCGKNYEVRECLKDMDKALEAFLEAINCDRV